MKSNILLYLNVTLLVIATSILPNCAIVHKRGADPQVTIDYYLQNRGAITNELTKMVSLEKLKEADVTVQWTVDEKGETKNVEIINDTLHNESVNTLLIEHLKTMKFPKTPHFTTTTVEYTYKFKATDIKR